VGLLGCLRLLVEGSEIADIERQNSAARGRGEGELFLVGSRIVASVFGRQNVVAAAAEIGGQPFHDMPVKVEANEQCLKAGGIGHGPRLPER
jgi:hypothetical protein